MKIVFMGTPDFARTILEGLCEAGHEILAVYTQPDRPKGRSGALVASPVKEYAIEKGYEVYQPEKIKETHEVEILKTFDADIFVVAAFGQFLSEEILNMPKFGCVNIHGSLLPKYRGAAPIQRAIMDGELTTGVTVMQMAKGMDSGDIISVKEVEITSEDNEITMYDKLACEGAKLLLTTLKDIENLTAVRTPQNPELVTFAPPLKKEEGEINFETSAFLVERKVKGMCVWPVASMSLNHKGIKVYDARRVTASLEEIGVSREDSEMKPGTFIVTKKHIYITTLDGLLELIDVKPEGKKNMSGMDFARGQHLVTGMCVD